jgi:hypothetical protein
MSAETFLFGGPIRLAQGKFRPSLQFHRLGSISEWVALRIGVTPPVFVIPSEVEESLTVLFLCLLTK